MYSLVRFSNLLMEYRSTTGEYTMFRFSRDKRFYSRISFEEFSQAATMLAAMANKARSSAKVEILTTEDTHTHLYSQVTFMADEVTEALKGRKSYSFEEFTDDVWSRSMSAQLTIKDEADLKPFMICLSFDKDEPRSMKFYGQAVEQELIDLIHDTFSSPSLFYKVGDGYSKPSAFNFAFGQRLTGIRLK